MKTTIHALLAVAVLSGAVAGCASKPKPQPATLGEASPGVPRAEAPLAPSPSPDGARNLQSELAATAGDRVFFAFDSAAVDVDAADILRRQAAWLVANPDLRARIEGHADERGTREYNLALGARRAAAARQALIAAGVTSDRLQTISFGKERPLDPGSGESAWARNRNAQTVVNAPPDAR